jgi:hypothetical protein
MVNDIKSSLIIPMHFKTRKAGRMVEGVDRFIEGNQHVRTIPRSEIEVSVDILPNDPEIILLQYEK